MRPRRPITIAALLAPTMLALPACSSRRADSAEERASRASTTTGHADSLAADGARMVGTIEGLHSPESVRYDPAQDAWLVSNMFGFGSVRDDNGYIVRASASDPTRSSILVEGGRHGVELHAPKGMALHGDTLWVADIDVLRGFDRTSGAPLAAIDLRSRGAQLLNDVTIGPDGSIYITDTGIAMTPKGVIHTGGDKIFAIGPDRAISLLGSGEQMQRPNGITWDSAGKRLLVVTFDPFHSEIYAMHPGDTTRTPLETGIGKFDGIELLHDGRMLVTCWNDSSLHVFAGGRDTRIIRDLWAPADLGVDERRQRVAIPVGMRDRVEIWTLPPARVAAR